MTAKPRIILTAGVLATLVLLTFLVVDKLSIGRPSNIVLPDILFDKFTLNNGLTVILHEDHTSPWVAINVWYHAGSKDERPDRHGIAHFCEHLMFTGTEHRNEDFSKAVERFGARNYNGTTDRDRTRFFMEVPKSALGPALWLESERMGYAIGAVTAKKLQRVRAEIEEETTSSKNPPYGFVEGILARQVYPADHPYYHHPLWSVEGLKSISLSDVKEWFRSYYHPSNAVLVLVGDIDILTARHEVTKYFGGLNSSNAINNAFAAVRGPYHPWRQTVVAPVPNPRIYMVWSVPAYASPDADYLDLFRHLLRSRLEDRLVHQERLATSISVFLKSFELCGQFQIEVDTPDGGDLVAVERVVSEQMKSLISHGLSEKELEDLKAELLASFKSDIEHIGGFGGKSDLLAISEVFAGDPDHYRKSLLRMLEATPQDVKSIAYHWLSNSPFVLYISDHDEHKPPRGHGQV